MPVDDRPNLKKLVMDRVAAIPELIGILAGGVDGIFPNTNASMTATTPTPFILVRMGTIANVDDIAHTVGFDIWAYDSQNELYWRIDRIHDLISKQLDEWTPPVQSAQGVVDRFMREFISDEGADDELNKLFKFARYRAWLIPA